jgi:hypothetical protein
MVVVAGCAESSQSSKYPANLSGRVTTAEKMICYTHDPVPPMGQGNIFWVVQISVKNVSYSQPISYYGLQIVANNVAYIPGVLGNSFAEPFNLSLGQSTQLTLVFSIPRTVAVEDAQIYYSGQAPASFGKLSKVGAISVYDCVAQSAINVTPTPNTETYVIRCEMASGRPVYMQLKTIASWQGTSSQTKDFTVTQVPCIINYGWQATSQISSSVNVNAWDSHNMSPYPKLCWGESAKTMELDAVGKYRIEITSVGAQWWVKIGVEP